ncbi:MAG: 5-bromo-4-chloroindolyl phosphate hydrolysis family protein [Lachnospiraceae bacterium]|nr:5-bromo-4-chloroindolyl phosphate hydrolysis family protein [Lachnospiraceae bacterium]
MEIIYSDNQNNGLEKKKRKKNVKGAFLYPDEAKTYLSKSKKLYSLIGIAVWMIITGVGFVPLLGTVGVFFMFFMLAIAVPMIIFGGNQVGDYEELDGTPIYLDTQTYAEIEAQRLALKPRFSLGIAAGVGSILLAVGAMSAFGMNPGLFLFAVGFAVFLFIKSGGDWSIYDFLLGKGDYEYRKKRMQLEDTALVALTQQNYDGMRIENKEVGSFGRFEEKVLQGEDKLAEPAKNVFATPRPLPLTPVNTGDSVHVDGTFDQILKQGNAFISALNHVKYGIMNREMVENTDEIITITNKILYRLKEDPKLIDSERRFFDYFVPTTEKLITSYASMELQGVSGENIKGTMTKIEKAVADLTVAYKAQLDKLYYDTSIDLEAEISALEVMLKKDGLFSDGENDIRSFLN